MLTYPRNVPECSIDRLVELAVGTGSCACLERGETMAHCLNALPGEALHEFFQKCLQALRAMGPEETARATRTLRSRLGMWYSIGLTTVLDISGGGTEEAIGKRMNALAVEALHWVDSSFLAHVVLWSRELALHQSGAEELLVSTAVAMPNETPDIEDVFRRYDLGLRSYVGKHGSTVRRDVHLQQVRRHIGNDEHPSLRSDGRTPRLSGAGQPITLCLPSEPTLIGSDAEWRDLLKRELSSSCGTAFEFLQLAAGSDSWYADAASRVGAVAHLYLVSPERKQFAREYVETMREHLNRLALDYSTAVIRELRELAMKNAEFHQSLNTMLTRETQELDRALQQVENQSRRLRVLVASDMWSILVQWVRDLGPLFKTGALVSVCGCTIVGKHGNWEDLEYLAALLMLTGESADSDAPGRRTEAEAMEEDYRQQTEAYLARRWSEYIDRAQTERPATMTQVHRCLARLGIFSYRPPEAVELKGSAFLYYDVWKDALAENLEKIQQTPSILAIAYCMGARFDPGYPEASSTQPEDEVSVASPLRIGVVASGLCKLLEALCENSIGLETPLTVRMDTSGEKSWCVRLSPVSITQGATTRDEYLIDEEGLARLFRTVTSFAAKEAFPWTSTSEWQRETTQALFRALGQDEASWVRTTRTIHDTPAKQEMRVLDESYRVIARMYTQRESDKPELWAEFEKQNQQ
jgi:hypothetical protein